jgi:uncharacterized protein YaaW (UPF0174 family)
MRHPVARPSDDRISTSPLLKILQSAEDVDLEFIVGVLKSPVGLSADRVMDQALEDYQSTRSAEARLDLAELLEREIRYAGSSDLAYLFRWIWSDDAGVRPDELLEDVAGKLNVRIRTIGTFEAKLQRLVRAVVEKELLKMTPEQQQDLIARQDLGVSKTHEFVKHLKQKGPLGGLPLLLNLAGREAAEQIATALVVRVIAIAVGRHTAAQLIKSLAARFPWWAEWIGPAAWAFTSAWVAVDLLGPAFRKTIPVVLYLGLVTLRDRPNHGDFFSED